MIAPNSLDMTKYVVCVLPIVSAAELFPQCPIDGMLMFYHNYVDKSASQVRIAQYIIRKRVAVHSPLIPSPGVCQFDAVPHDVLVYLFAYWEMPSELAHVLRLRGVCTRWRDAVAAGHYDVDIRHLSHVITDARLRSLVKCMPRTRVLHVQLGDAITNDSILVCVFSMLCIALLTVCHNHLYILQIINGTKWLTSLFPC